MKNLIGSKKAIAIDFAFALITNFLFILFLMRKGLKIEHLKTGLKNNPVLASIDILVIFAGIVINTSFIVYLVYLLV